MWSKGRLKVTHLQSSVSLFAHLPLLHDVKSAQFICSHHTTSTKIPEHQSIKSIVWRKKHVKEWLWIPLKMLEIWFCSVQYFSNISPNANFFSLSVDAESTPQFPFNLTQNPEESSNNIGSVLMNVRPTIICRTGTFKGQLHLTTPN